MIKKILICIVYFFLVVSCKNPRSQEVVLKASSSVDQKKEQIWTDVEYNFDSPDVFYLDSRLTEISGLAYSEDNDFLIAHNDERGDIYELNPLDGSIVNIVNFGGIGDYESVEYLNGEYIIGQSNGDIFSYNRNRDQTITFEVGLSSKNDVEGMCYDFDLNHLLLACKGQPFEYSKSKKVKAIYAYDISSNTLLEDPFLTLHDDDIARVVERTNVAASRRRLKKLIKRACDFSPSGIAKNAMTKEYYLISARGSTLFIVDKQKGLREVIFLNDQINKQPEGITFDKNYNMYICTEGKGMRAKIFKFRNID